MGTDAIQERLGKLPPTLKELYNEIHERFSRYSAEAERAIIKNVLVWLLCGQQTLKSEEFLAMVAVSPKLWLTEVSHDLILQLCCDFVVYDNELDVFRFAHLSVREFLEDRPDYTTTIINARAAETCLFVVITASPHPIVGDFLRQYEYIKGYENHVDRKIVRPGFAGIIWSFDLYSKLYWPVHCQLAEEGASQGILPNLLEFFMSSNIDQTWPYNVWYSSLDRFMLAEVEQGLTNKLMSSGPEPLFGACAFDLVGVAQQKMTLMSLLDLENREGSSPLYVAMRFHSLRVMRVLLNCPQISVGGEVLYTAARTGADIIALLLDLRGEQLTFSSDVLSAAARNEKVLRLLIDRRASDIIFAEELACVAGQVYFNSWLLIVSKLPGGSSNMLLEAATNGCLRICNMMLRTNRFNVDGRGGLRETALHRAAANGQLEVATTLLNYGANPHLRSTTGETPLSIATKSEHQTLASLLEAYLANHHWISSNGEKEWCPRCLRSHLVEQGHVFCSSCGTDIPHGDNYHRSIQTVVLTGLRKRQKDDKILSPSHPEFPCKHAVSGGTIIEHCDTCFNQNSSVNTRYPNKYATYAPEVFHSMVQPPVVEGKQAREKRPLEEPRDTNSLKVVKLSKDKGL